MTAVESIGKGRGRRQVSPPEFCERVVLFRSILINYNKCTTVNGLHGKTMVLRISDDQQQLISDGFFSTLTLTCNRVLDVVSDSLMAILILSLPLIVNIDEEVKYGGHIL